MRVLCLVAFLVFSSYASSSSVPVTLAGAASQTQTIAKAAAGTVASGVKQEGKDVAIILQAILKKVLGDANYQQLMALIGKVVKNIQLAIANVQKQAQAAIAGIQKQMAGASATTKPIDALWQELNAQSTIQSAVGAGVATAQSAAKTLNADALKELNLIVKVAEAVLKGIIGDSNYKKLAAMLIQLFKGLQAAVTRVVQTGQGLVVGLGKGLSGKAILQELSTQSTIQGAVNNGVATAQSGAKALFGDAKKEANVVVNVLEVIIKKIIGEANYKQLMAMINFLITAAKNAVAQAAKEAARIQKTAQGVVAGLAAGLSGKPKMVVDDYEDASTQSTIQSAVQSGVATAQSGAKTIAADAKKEANILVTIIGAVLQQLLGQKNYQALMAMINNLIAQAKGAAGQAQKTAAQIVAALQKQLAGIMAGLKGSSASGSKPFDFQEASTASTIQNAAQAGAATAAAAGKTIAGAANKELGLLAKVLGAILKQVVGDKNYQAIVAMIANIVAQLKAAAGKAQAAAAAGVKQLQGFVAGIQKQLAGSPKAVPLQRLSSASVAGAVIPAQELSTASTIQGAVAAGAATAQSGVKTLAVDAQKELNLLVKVLEAVVKGVLGEQNFKLLMAAINNIIAQLKTASTNAQAAAGQAVKQIQGVIAAIQKQMAGSSAGGAKPFKL